MDITNKIDVLNYINEHNKEHGGSFTTERGFKKHFSSLYSEFEKTTFPLYFEGFDFKQKLWHFLRDDYEQRICGCGGLLKFRSFWYGYNDFCRQNCPSMIDNQKQKVIDYNNNLTDVERERKRLLQEETTLKHYGVKRYSQTKEWKEKTKRSNKERFGSEWFSQTDAYKDDYRRKSIEKYGVENPMFSDDIRNKWKESIDNKYNNYWYNRYPNIIEVKESSLLCGCCDESCNLCLEKKYEIDKHLFSDRVFHNIDTCIVRTPYNELTSGGERMLFDFIKSVYIGEIIENDRSVLNGKELDIYLPELKLAFEFNGIYWHGEKNKSTKYHQEKSLMCIENGIQLIHVWEDDWTYRKDIIKDFIKSKLGLSEINIGARKCDIRSVDNKTAKVFLDTYHIQGSVRNGKSIGLFYNNELIELMTFGQLRKNMGSIPKDGVYEIYRVCSKIGYNIQGGFSKLLRYFEKTYKPIEVITYANLDYSVGNVYDKCGFIRDSISKPVYTWVINGKRCYRSNFMKSKLEEYKENPKLTESEIMYNRGSWKCWDSGKIKFIKRY